MISKALWTPIEKALAMSGTCHPMAKETGLGRTALAEFLTEGQDVGASMRDALADDVRVE